MDDKELLYRWNHRALKPSEMVKVLAELNAVCPKCMQIRLEDLGVNVTGMKEHAPRWIPEEVFHAISYYRAYLEGLFKDENVRRDLNMSKELREHIDRLDRFEERNRIVKEIS